MLMRSAEVRDAWTGIASRFRDAILQLPQKLAPQVLACTTMRQSNEVIRKKCEALLHQVADDLM
jgi:hypothetical protein